MLRPSVAVVSIAIPSFAQVQTPLATGQTETQFINIPVYSSDGEHLGRVIGVAMSDGRCAAFVRSFVSPWALERPQY